MVVVLKRGKNLRTSSYFNELFSTRVLYGYKYCGSKTTLANRVSGVTSPVSHKCFILNQQRLLWSPAHAEGNKCYRGLNFTPGPVELPWQLPHSFCPRNSLSTSPKTPKYVSSTSSISHKSCCLWNTGWLTATWLTDWNPSWLVVFGLNCRSELLSSESSNEKCHQFKRRAGVFCCTMIFFFHFESYCALSLLLLLQVTLKATIKCPCRIQT